MWYLDSSYSRHMTRDKSKFVSLTIKQEGFVTYGYNNKGKILGYGNVGTSQTTCIENVLYVEGLKHNLLSISQLCDKGFDISFTSSFCMIFNPLNDMKLKGNRLDNIYMLDLEKAFISESKCLLSKNDDAWIWHRRFAHIHMNHLNKIIAKDLVIGLPKPKF